jgi:hypothetical protein
MTHPAALQVENALDELVNQFSDPLSFLRELVQNALDAGSEEVEIDVTYEPPGKDDEGGTGVAVVQVDDFGEGMTREIIEKRLTRLFSSAKDGDQTKIGKFGIGFVSVFAIQPDAVCVDTSREGEHWRVLFSQDRRFKLIRRSEPVDGTKIRILKSMPPDEFEPFVLRARRVVEYWCKHTRGEVRFAGEVINHPLALDAPCQVVADDGFSRVIVGHAPDQQPFFGFYNTGLTLLEGRDEYFDGVAFKVSSPHLEHTLTRDAVIHDAGYHRVMETVRGLVQGQLFERVFGELEQALGGDDAETLDYLYHAAVWHAQRLGNPWDRADGRVAFVSPSGKRLRVGKMRSDTHRDDRILMSQHDNPLTRALEEAGATVLRSSPDLPVGLLANRLAPENVEIHAVEELFAMPLPPKSDREYDRFAVLARAVQGLLDDCGMRVGEVVVGHFEYDGSPIASDVAITQKSFGEVSSLAEVRSVGTGLFSGRRTLVLNADHAAVGDLVQLAAVKPQFAAYLLSKLFFLGGKLDAQLDGQLAAKALERAGG